jgi:hypothetical protein
MKIALLKKKKREDDEYEELRKEYSELKYGKIFSLSKKIVTNLGKMADAQHNIEKEDKKRKKKSF